VRGRQKGILDLKGSGSKGLHGSSARTKPTRRRRCLRAAPPALSHATQGLFERSPRPLPHPTETPNPPPFPSRGAIAPNPEVSLLAPGAVERSAENDQIPLDHTLPLSSQGPDSKALCPICTTTTRPVAIGASTQPTCTKEAISA
jgi:hypothetical protein